MHSHYVSSRPVVGDSPVASSPIFSLRRTHHCRHPPGVVLRGVPHAEAHGGRLKPPPPRECLECLVSCFMTLVFDQRRWYHVRVWNVKSILRAGIFGNQGIDLCPEFISSMLARKRFDPFPPEILVVATIFDRSTATCLDDSHLDELRESIACPVSRTRCVVGDLTHRCIRCDSTRYVVDTLERRAFGLPLCTGISGAISILYPVAHT